MAIIRTHWKEICSRYFVAYELLRDASHSVLKTSLLQIDIRFLTPQLDHKMDRIFKAWRFGDLRGQGSRARHSRATIEHEVLRTALLDELSPCRHHRAWPKPCCHA